MPKTEMHLTTTVFTRDVKEKGISDHKKKYRICSEVLAAG